MSKAEEAQTENHDVMPTFPFLQAGADAENDHQHHRQHQQHHYHQSDQHGHHLAVSSTGNLEACTASCKVATDSYDECYD